MVQGGAGGLGYWPLSGRTEAHRYKGSDSHQKADRAERLCFWHSKESGTTGAL